MNKEIKEMPILPLRGVTIFPEMVMYFDVGREKSIKALEKAMKEEHYILAVTQRNASTDEPCSDDLYTIGTIVEIKQMTKIGDNQFKVFVKGKERAQLIDVKSEAYLSATVEIIHEELGELKAQEEALARTIAEQFEKYAALNPKVSDEVLYGILNLKNPIEMMDIIIGHISLDTSKKQEILECLDIKQRMYQTVEILINEISILTLQKEIMTKVKSNIDQSQKEYFLREELKVIQEELGDKDGIAGDIERYKKQMLSGHLPQQVIEKLEKEIQRLKNTSSNSPESGNIRAYIETVLELPWNQTTQESSDIKKAAEIFEKEHYGLKEIKERVLEYLAIKELANEVIPPILCLVGLPGVGKTSIAKSIAHATHRNYVRISLGGVRDEAEIRGHRRTYVGAIPGRFINALIEAKSNNPIMLLDEIDKMSSDFKGDPGAALLEVLDANQNAAFKDHYLELPVDLSKVMFIATANSLKGIPKPLLDRMEIIEVSSYTVLEKLQIATKYLLPTQLTQHHLSKSQLKISKNQMLSLIEHYTKEAGVRSLQRLLAKICRKAAREIVETGETCVKLTPTKLKEYLGSPLFEFEEKNKEAQIGVVRGLAWTSIGGETLSVEVNCMKGKGDLKLTGQMGDVMKESAMAAVSFIRSRVQEMGIQEDFYKTQDMHIHIPEGAVPKDGPSAGITMATAMISALIGKPIRPDIAMTGEITIRGRVLPIGGLREKLLAAKRAKIKTVIVPLQNKKHVEEIEDTIKNDLEIIYATSMEQVLEHVFV